MTNAVIADSQATKKIPHSPEHSNPILDFEPVGLVAARVVASLQKAAA